MPQEKNQWQPKKEKRGSKENTKGTLRVAKRKPRKIPKNTILRKQKRSLEETQGKSKKNTNWNQGKLRDNTRGNQENILKETQEGSPLLQNYNPSSTR
jgi:hypothetical protein